MIMQPLVTSNPRILKCTKAMIQKDVLAGKLEVNQLKWRLGKISNCGLYM